MNKKTFSFIVAALFLIIFSSTECFALRKDSFLGKMVDSAKKGTAAIKNDVKNYNTFIVQLNVTNKSQKCYLVEIYNKRIEFHPHNVAIMPVYSENICPNQQINKKIELTAYYPLRDFTFVVFDNSGANSIFFDPSKRDYIEYTIE